MQPFVGLGCKMAFSNGKSFVPLRCWSINCLSSIMWINEEYPSCPVSVQGYCGPSKSKRCLVFVVHPAPSQGVPGFLGYSANAPHTYTHTQRLKLILVKTK